ncbi:hypothetical protein SUGI_0811960 [Cryptomeria japonica]|nr:hypothetical protein SUGI_0811960 [Cryptomeria japonica]
MGMAEVQPLLCKEDKGLDDIGVCKYEGNETFPSLYQVIFHMALHMSVKSDRNHCMGFAFFRRNNNTEDPLVLNTALIDNLGISNSISDFAQQTNLWELELVPTSLCNVGERVHSNYYKTILPLIFPPSPGKSCIPPSFFEASVQSPAKDLARLIC